MSVWGDEVIRSSYVPTLPHALRLRGGIRGLLEPESFSSFVSEGEFVEDISSDHVEDPIDLEEDNAWKKREWATKLLPATQSKSKFDGLNPNMTIGEFLYEEKIKKKMAEYEKLKREQEKDNFLEMFSLDSTSDQFCECLKGRNEEKKESSGFYDSCELRDEKFTIPTSWEMTDSDQQFSDGYRMFYNLTQMVKQYKNDTDEEDAMLSMQKTILKHL
ncbi:hypothetical protein GUITHDRAFT_112243 [Guillardia theta CCMP2712]|uniref:Uncharacterized protein n=2 Tax=Guillardia theta TaxID=55529 RepID=L1J127_GUITC|nr:hypothetical protein GUITHDRAFT_112243 [Guillardia theta CCMP2712]EKX41824.1 hypothetical protein GUITHDRAFT_112243 [Guillardia theta CCMP2712]|eukprot:XP_005828804.1 hypothetical protein GUITHDRAFT_112243 [Guillardia theta CCMP2712]